MYSRFTALQDHSEEHQEKLEESTVAIIGLGATGSAIAENMARHGASLIIVDRDYLEEKDTYSSSIYTPKQCSRALPKAEAAKEHLEKFTEVEAYSESLSPKNLNLVSSADIILDGTDNIETRQLINDYSKKKNIPWIYTAAISEIGYSMPFNKKCFNCMVQRPEKVATCETDGIMREIAQKAAASTAFKAVKYLTTEELEEKLEFVHQNRKLSVEAGGCKVCEEKDYPHLQNFDTATRVCGKNKFQLQKDVSDKAIESAMNSGEVLAENDYLVRVKYESREITLFRSGRVILEAEDSGHAEALLSEVAGI